MNQLEQPVAEIQSVGDVLQHLAIHGVSLTNRHDLDAYLSEHRDLAYLLDDMCKQVRAVFGPAAELALEVYHDPEIEDRYLTLYVRQETYSPDIIDQIETVCSEFHHPLEAVTGYFLVTTDFKRSRGAHVV